MESKIKIQYISVNKLKHLPNNPRLIKDGRFEKLCKSIETLPNYFEARPLLVNDASGELIVYAGNMRLKAAKHLKLKAVPCIIETLSEQEQRERTLRDNIELGQWDFDILANEFSDFDLTDLGIELPELNFKQDLKTDDNYEPLQLNKLEDIFVIPPFSILDTRAGYWQEKKRVFRELIGYAGESREGTITRENNYARNADFYPEKLKKENELRRKLTNDEFIEKYYDTENKQQKTANITTSLFDPVLMQVICTWFAPEKSKIFDPFAGDYIKGWVANYCGHFFKGIELRNEQVEINVKKTQSMNCEYICDDGQNIQNHIGLNSQDLLFSCPPYFDLEIYSDLPNDASNQKDYKQFLQILDNAFCKAIQCLKRDRFAVIVVGDIRNKKGFYFDFISDIKRIFIQENMFLYNELILVEIAGNAAMRASNQMKNRKVAKTHQNVLVFYNGDPKNIQKEFKDLKFEYINTE